MALAIKPNKCCYFCNVHLPAGAAIPLFTLTKNKEFTGKSCFTADSIVLSDLFCTAKNDVRTSIFDFFIRLIVFAARNPQLSLLMLSTCCFLMYWSGLITSSWRRFHFEGILAPLAGRTFPKTSWEDGQHVFTKTNYASNTLDLLFLQGTVLEIS